MVADALSWWRAAICEAFGSERPLILASRCSDAQILGSSAAQGGVVRPEGR